MPVASVNTRWIDENGHDADLRARTGRLGNDIALFAVHTMGWIRVQEIVRFWDIEFDPRAVQPAAVASLCGLVRRLNMQSLPWAARVRAYDGADWLVHTIFAQCRDDVDKLIEWIEAIARFGQDPLVPSALEVADLGEPDLTRKDDPMLAEIASAWRDTGGAIAADPADPFMQMRWKPLPCRSVKVLARSAPSGALVFASYFPARTELWAEGTVRRFQHARVCEEVPDRALAAKVVESAEATLAQRRVRSERVRGPVRRSDGSVVHVDWQRISLPACLDGAAVPNAVIVYCHATSVMDLRQAAS